MFHVSLLQPFNVRAGESAPNTQAPALLHEDPEQEEWEVEKILDVRSIGATHEYLLQWKGYGPEWNVWTSEKDLGNIDELKAEFELRTKAQGKPQLLSRKRSEELELSYGEARKTPGYAKPQEATQNNRRSTALWHKRQWSIIKFRGNRRQ